MFHENCSKFLSQNKKLLKHGALGYFLDDIKRFPERSGLAYRKRFLNKLKEKNCLLKHYTLLAAACISSSNWKEGQLVPVVSSPVATRGLWWA